MNKEDAISFASLMEDYLKIPSFVCEYIEQALIDGKYKEVIEYIIQRRNEIGQGSNSNVENNNQKRIQRIERNTIKIQSFYRARIYDICRW